MRTDKSRCFVDPPQAKSERGKIFYSHFEGEVVDVVVEISDEWQISQ